MDSRQLILWCVEANINLKKMFENRNTSILTSEKSLSELVEVWIRVAETVLQSSLRFWALNCLNAPDSLCVFDQFNSESRSSSDPLGENEGVIFSLETMRLVGVMIMDAGEVICCSHEGNDLINKCIDILITIGCEDIVESGLRSVVRSPYCLKDTRGLWCARLVRYSVTLTKQSKINKNGNGNKNGNKNGKGKNIDDMSDDEDEVEKEVENAAGKNSCQCEEIYYFIENIFHTHPELLVGSHVRSFYEIVLSVEMSAATSNKSTNYAFVSTVANRAIENCPYVHSFWDICEKILRLQGKHKDANHIRWRREKESNP